MKIEEFRKSKRSKKVAWRFTMTKDDKNLVSIDPGGSLRVHDEPLIWLIEEVGWDKFHQVCVEPYTISIDIFDEKAAFEFRLRFG